MFHGLSRLVLIDELGHGAETVCIELCPLPSICLGVTFLPSQVLPGHQSVSWLFCHDEDGGGSDNAGAVALERDWWFGLRASARRNQPKIGIKNAIGSAFPGPDAYFVTNLNSIRLPLWDCVQIALIIINV